MTYLDHATAVARSLNLLDSNGELVTLDSLTIVDYVTELEDVTTLEIPTDRLVPDVFASLRGVVAMLESVAAGASSAASL